MLCYDSFTEYLEEHERRTLQVFLLGCHTALNYTQVTLDAIEETQRVFGKPEIVWEEAEDGEGKVNKHKGDASHQRQLRKLGWPRYFGVGRHEGRVR